MPAKRPTPPPLHVDDVRVVLVGTSLFALAFVALLPFAGRLEDDGRLWWLAACACGFALGLLGLWTVRRRAAAIARAQSSVLSESSASASESASG